MKLQKILIILTLLLSLSLLSSIVYAEQFDVITTPVSYNFIVNPIAPTTTACLCANTNIPVQIINTGTYATKFHLSSDDSKLSFSRNDILLKPGEEQTVLAKRANSCLTLSSSKEITIFARSSFGISKNISTKLSFSDCDSTSFAFDKRVINSSICKPFNTTLYITNNGLLKQNYTIEPLTGIVNISAGSVIIPPKETASIVANYDLPCDLYGSYDLKYRVTSSTGKSYIIQQELNLPYTYNYTLIYDQDVAVCSKEKSSIIFTLENTNNFDDVFNLEIESNKFASFQNDSKELSLNLSAGESKDIIIFLDPSNKNLGSNDLLIEVEDVFGHLEKNLFFNISVKNCYDVTSAFWIPKKKYVCENDNLSIPFSLINNGVEASPVSLLIEGPNYVSFNQSNVVVPAGVALEVNLNFNIPKNISWGSYPYKISIYSRGELIGSDEFVLETQPSSFCYHPVLKNSKKRILFDEDNFTLRLENWGTRQANYFIDLSVNDSNASFTLLNDSLVLDSKAGVDLLVIADFNKSVDDSYNITMTLFESNSGKIYSYPLLITVVDHSWIAKLFTSVWNTIYYTTPCVLIASLLILLILIFFLIVICRSYKKRVFVFKKKFFWSLLIILLVVFAFIYFAYGFERPYPNYNLSSNSTTHILMKEDVSKTINLSNYFYDPDGDIVEYGVSTLDSSVLSFNISDDLLTLVPVSDFYGDTMIRLFASDSYGATAESRQIRVDVLPMPDYTCYSFYLKYCAYFNWLLLFLFFIFLFLSFSYKKKAKEYQRTLNEVIVVRSKGVKRIPFSKKSTQSTGKKSTGKPKTSAKKSAKSTKKNITKKSTTKKLTTKTSTKNSTKKSSKRTTKTASKKKTPVTTPISESPMNKGFNNSKDSAGSLYSPKN